MAKLKQLTVEVVPAALEKALRYRLLNEPHEAESICCDVLEIEPHNKEARITLLLAITDQFQVDFHAAMQRAKEALQRLDGAYEQAYYGGIVHERWAKAQLSRGVPIDVAISWFREAMRSYEKAETLSPPNDPDAILRWNTCLRFIQRNADVATLSSENLTEDVHASFGDDVPPR